MVTAGHITNTGLQQQQLQLLSMTISKEEDDAEERNDMSLTVNNHSGMDTEQEVSLTVINTDYDP